MSRPEPKHPPAGVHGLEAMQALARGMASVVQAPLVIYLEGELGAGKTTLVRALVQALGYQGRVKSPTYGLLERYVTPTVAVLHLDLYRIADPGELEFLGITDLFDSETVLLVEWPQRGGLNLPGPDLTIRLEHHARGRRLDWQVHTTAGGTFLEALARLPAISKAQANSSSS